MGDRDLVESNFRLAASDINRGVGLCEVVLKGSGHKVQGRVNMKLTDESVLTLDDGDYTRGWCVVAWEEVAMIGGVPGDVGRIWRSENRNVANR